MDTKPNESGGSVPVKNGNLQKRIGRGLKLQSIIGKIIFRGRQGGRKIRDGIYIVTGAEHSMDFVSWNNSFSNL